MTTAALAADPDVRERFRITHVVTVGSPVARTVVPAGVQVLALENRYDLVPRLDGRSNDPAANITTVTFEAQHGSVGENHALSGLERPGYAQLAGTMPATDPSVRAWHDGAAGFLDPRNRVVPHDHERQVVTRQDRP